MRKFLTLLALCTIGQLALAQTYKSIHRSDGPVVRIPVHLIDTVRTVSTEDGEMLSVQLNTGLTTQVPLALIDSITHREGSVVNPTELGAIGYGSVMGVVTDHTGNAVVDAVVYAGFSSEQTITDTNGVFFLDSIAVYESLGLIKVEKDGYFKGSRSFLPIADGRNLLRIELSPRVLIGSFHTSAGGTVSTNGLTVMFPPNSIARDGQPYTGQVNVYATVFDPTEPTFNDRMPGDLIGGMSDSLQMLRSFGMTDVEIEDEAGIPVQIASGSEATLTFTVPDVMLAEAPSQIDFWSFDSEIGYWLHEGEAVLVGNTYVGMARHFSPYNWDGRIVTEEIIVLVVECKDNNGRPIAGGRLTFAEFLGGAGVYTNAEGKAAIRVSRGMQINVSLSLYCETFESWPIVSTQVVPPLFADGSTVITGQLPETYHVSGTVLDCEENPVSSGYVVSNRGNIAFLHEGNFDFRVCDQGLLNLRAFQTFADSMKVSQLVVAMVGPSGVIVNDLITCWAQNSTITDIEGNIYNTVVIGTQEWMAENLRTTTYRDGTPIPFAPDSQWESYANISSGAWCYYDNDPNYANSLGVLYNWYAAVYSSCPEGWHVPTDDEWNILVGFIDPLYDPLGLGSQSGIAGGKMKSTGTEYWLGPNIDATNETGFTGLPGGGRATSPWSFYNLGETGYWWSSTPKQGDDSRAWYRAIVTTSGDAGRGDTLKAEGYSIRCVRD